jgi:hypothetical protein
MKRFLFPAMLALFLSVPETCPGLPAVEKPVAEFKTGLPEQVMWSPLGGSIWISTVDDDQDTSKVSEIIVATGERRDFSLPGPIRAFQVGPNEELLSTIHEDAHERVLRIWNVAEKTARDIYRDTRNLYFPVVNTIDPWQGSGERLVFYRARLHERHLMVWEAAGAEVREVTQGRRADRSFWDREGSLLVPQGVPFETVLAGKPDRLTGVVEIDFTKERDVFHQLPAGYPTIFPFSRQGVAVLKDEVVPPLLLDLSTWEATPLPSTVERFLDLAWSPDGSMLAYPLNGREYHRIVTFDVRTGDTRLVWVDEGFLAGSLCWSPSGKYLAATLLETAGRSEARAVVLDAGTGETLWSRAREPRFVERYFQRGRKSLRWHPSEDTLLLWDRAEIPDGPAGVEIRVVEFGQ